jgi:hypothetical protein
MALGLTTEHLDLAAAVALEERGRALLPGAYLPTVLASAVLAEAACQAEVAGAIVGVTQAI